MKKTHLFLVSIIATLLVVQPALAQTTETPDYPATPTEIVQLFEQQWGNSYDVINDDLRLNETVAREWAGSARLAEFGISFADGMDNGYYFKFIDPQNADEIMTAYPTLDDEAAWINETVENTDNLDKQIYNVDLTLRKLIPKMLSHKRLLPSLNEGYVENANTDMWLTLKQNEDNISNWYIDFNLLDNEGKVVKSYLVWIPAGTNIKSDFKVVRTK